MFTEPSIYENFKPFLSQIHNYQGHDKEIFNSCHGENCIINNENVVSYVPVRECNDIDDLAKKI